jgi:CRP-like cAMP-binding protein
MDQHRYPRSPALEPPGYGLASNRARAARSPRLDALIRERLAGAGLRGVRTLALPKGKDVVIGGSHGDCVYFNHDGWLARYKILHKGSRQIIDFILPGRVFGWPACFFERALYSVLTITETTVWSIPFETMDEALDNDPTLAKALFASMAHEAAILGEHLIDAGRRSAYERVSHLLLELFVRLHAAHADGEMTFTVPLTQELIADALGLTTVHVNRTLRALREDRLIAMDGRSITILDYEALSLLSDFENAYLGEVFPASAGRSAPDLARG